MLACVKTCSQTRNTIGGGAFLYALLVHKVATKAPAAPAATKSGGGRLPLLRLQGRERRRRVVVVSRPGGDGQVSHSE